MMTKRFVISMLFLLSPLSLFGQSLGGINGDCMIGGQQALTSGLPSTATQQIGTTNVNAGAGVQASFPGCIVTVYLTGTLNKANVFSDNNPTPTPESNPFTANIDGSYTFFVGQGACYDITMSSGSVPLPYPRTLTDVCIGTGSGGGGGGGSIGPGTINHVAKFISTTNVGDSEGFATGTAPAAWPLGLDLVGSALEFDYNNSSSPGTIRYLLASLDGSLNARLSQPGDANNLLGIADQGAGTTGIVSVATYGRIPCTFDNQTAINDFVILGSGSQCHDVGATEAIGPQNFARVESINSGAGTNATVRIGLPDVTAAGGSGVVSPCATVGAIAYYNAVGSTIVCDPLFTTDGAGNFNAISGTFAGPSAGFIGFSQSSVPGLADANTTYFYAPASIPTTFGTSLPSAPGTLNQVLGISAVTDATHIVTSWINQGGIRTCMMIFGTDNGPALLDADIAPQGAQCFISATATALEVNVKADGGTPQLVVSKVSPSGTVTPLLSTALATAAAGAFACSNTGGTTGINGATTCSATLENTALPAGYYIQTTTATAGGTAKRLSVAVAFQ